MKRIIVLALLALLGVYLTGFLKLGESGAVRYLRQSESLTNGG